MCFHSFTSDADVERHYALIHNKTGREGNPFGHSCKFLVEEVMCNLVFPTIYFLGKHKREIGHLTKQGPAVEN